MAVTRNVDAVAPVKRRGALAVWMSRHVNDAAASFTRMLGNPFSSLMIVLVIGVTLALPAAVNVVVKNAALVSNSWDNAMDFSAYLDTGVSVSAAEALAGLLQQRADIEAVELITADEALEEFRSQSGFGDALGQLADNPLPHALVIRPAASNTSASLILMQEEIGNLPEVDFVQADTAWVRRFHAILDIVRQAIWIGAALLGLAVVIVIGNTIRLDIENRRDEIEVTKLIGASNAFVRRPFLWTGLWYGLLGGAMALGLVFIALALLEEPVARLAGLYQGRIEISALNAGESGAIVGVAVLLGLLGSWLTTTRHLRRIEPR